MVFSGEAADHYARYRRGYPPAALEFVLDRLGVCSGDLVVDLGCGTGQLAIPLAGRVRHVLGIDPEPDMLAHARQAAQACAVPHSTSWLLGSDADIPTLPRLLGHGAIAALTISNAVHLMDTSTLFPALAAILTPGATVAVIANGSPLWIQDSAWSQALRRFLQDRFASTSAPACGTDAVTRARYRAELEHAGFITDESHLDRSEPVSLEWIVGSLLSATPAHLLPAAEDRAAFTADIEATLRAAQPTGAFIEDVRLAVLVGRR
jgi:trans-aconitate methyltransferase